MKIEAILENGQLKLPNDIQFIQKSVRFVLDIPDSIVLDQNKLSEVEVRNIRDTIDEIFGDLKEQVYQNKINSTNYKELWHQHLEEKHLG